MDTSRSLLRPGGRRYSMTPLPPLATKTGKPASQLQADNIRLPSGCDNKSPHPSPGRMRLEPSAVVAQSLDQGDGYRGEGHGREAAWADVSTIGYCPSASQDANGEPLCRPASHDRTVLDEALSKAGINQESHGRILRIVASLPVSGTGIYDAAEALGAARTGDQLPRDNGSGFESEALCDRDVKGHHEITNSRNPQRRKASLTSVSSLKKAAIPLDPSETPFEAACLGGPTDRTASDRIIHTHEDEEMTRVRKSNTRWAKAHWWAMQESHRRTEEEVERLQSKFNHLHNKSANNAAAGNMEDKVACVKASFRRNSMHSVNTGTAGSLRSIISSIGETWLLKNSMEMGDEEELSRLRKKEEPPKSKGTQWLHTCLHSRAYVAFLIMITFYILFAEDIYVLVDPPVQHDLGLFSVSAACFFVYCLDLLARCLCEDGYICSFLFFLDAVAIGSLLPSVIVAFGLGTGTVLDSLHLLRSGRAATSGARLARFVRVLHFANRVVEELSLHKGTVSEMASRIDHHLSRHVITAVGAMLGVMLALSFVGEDYTQAQMERDVAVLGASFLQVKMDAEVFGEVVLQPYLDGLEQTHQRLLFLMLHGRLVHGSPDAITALRAYPPQWMAVEVECAGAEDHEGVSVRDCVLHVEAKQPSRDAAVSNLLLVVSLLVVLGGIAFFMSSAVRRELLAPIEKIVETMDQITLQPWKKLETEEYDAGREQEQRTILRSLHRVGNLLQLGFGEAGMKVISKSLKDGEMDFTQRGQRTHAIFGFCDIRNFTDCTEVLGADIVNLVNNVAVHVHQAVVDNRGAPNKNIGDAFLLVWKPKGGTMLEEVADCSLRSTITTMVEMQRCKVLRRWERRSDLQARMPGFSVTMGFGLHYGWAIEGAIGSQHKIDASYLSSSVNLASRLEAATKQYGTPILLSGELHGLLSEQTQGLCRLVDRVTVKGSKTPIHLYTYDAPTLCSQGGTLADDTAVPKDAKNSEFFSKFAPVIDAVFRRRWAKAVGRYLGGEDGSKADWGRAREHLHMCLELRPGDGPSQALLGVIGRTGAELQEGLVGTPTGWPGYRALTEK